LKPFANEPVLDLRRPGVRDSLLDALADLDRRLPWRVPVRVRGDAGAGDGIGSTDPGAPGRLVAEAGVASSTDVDAAVSAAVEAGRAWSTIGAEGRAAVLVRAADALRSRRLELAALQVRECAKPWGEADADVCEAIDFLEYYARGAVALEAGHELIQVPGERNTMRYVPRGVVAVISPWNFPLAIPTGMVAAGLATGNAVVLKPAEQSPGSAQALVEALTEAGVPGGALSLLPGYGETGAALARHPAVHVIAFTGSGPVGLELVRAAAEVPDDQRHVKRVVAEMGGKNCVFVHADADLDEAIPYIAASAYDYAGQKCSAAARVLVHDSIAAPFCERLAGAVRELVVGQAEAFGTDVPPLIEQEARDRVARYVERAGAEGEILARGDEVERDGWFVAPVLAGGLPDGSPVLREEIFGPLVAVERVAGVSGACEVMEASPFALTAGVFSRDPAVVREVSERAPAGNLYVNRTITGAVVGRQPFGGNRLSGVGSKAGGPDYLRQFVEPRVVSENTMRHGLVVD
jgi:RHH-type proline utilization regulon transcriptional repressor/proline dehydrogenase/delta 1-pyrroline-5-carboxylate dehydrogenase